VSEATLYSPTRALWLALRKRKPVPVVWAVGDTYPGKWPPAAGKWRLVEAELGGIPLWRKIGDVA
jgi:hypothetical protein